MITIDDFRKLNILIGTIEKVEDIEGSEKLYRFEISIGEEKRQILGGLKTSYSKDELLGKQVVFLVNLEPRMIMGMESQGMILAASDDEGKAIILQPLKEVKSGSVVR